MIIGKIRALGTDPGTSQIDSVSVYNQTSKISAYPDPFPSLHMLIKDKRIQVPIDQEPGGPGSLNSIKKWEKNLNISNY